MKRKNQLRRNVWLMIEAGLVWVISLLFLPIIYIIIRIITRR